MLNVVLGDQNNPSKSFLTFGHQKGIYEKKTCGLSPQPRAIQKNKERQSKAHHPADIKLLNKAQGWVKHGENSKIILIVLHRQTPYPSAVLFRNNVGSW